MEARRKQREDLHQLVDQLPEEEMQAAKRYLQFLRERRLPGLRAMLEAEEEDEELTDVAKRELQKRLRGAEAGGTVSHEQVLKELGG